MLVIFLQSLFAFFLFGIDEMKFIAAFKTKITIENFPNKIILEWQNNWQIVWFEKNY